MSTFEFIKRSTETRGDSCYLIYGVPNAGKTTLAVSASEHWPEAPSPEPIHLKDVLVLQHDKGALDSLDRVNVTVDVVDMSTCASIGEFVKMRKSLVTFLRKGGHGYKYLVHDTISQFDVYLTAMTDSLGLDGFDKYRRMLTEHRMYFTDFSTIPGVSNIFTVHAKVNFDPDGKKKLQQLPGFSDVTPSITGQAAGIYINQCSFVWPLIVEIKKTPKETITERYVLPHGGAGYQGRSKCGNYELKEPAVMSELIKKAKL